MTLDFPILYWREKTTKSSISDYDNVEKLHDAKIGQCLRLEIDGVREISSIIDGGPNTGTTNIPSYSAEGKKSIAKQLNGAIKYGMTITGSCKATDIFFRQKLRKFFFMPDVEDEYHKHGIFGFFHPDLIDFNLDPNDTQGYTITMPSDAFVGNSPINEVSWKFVLEWGGIDRR